MADGLDHPVFGGVRADGGWRALRPNWRVLGVYLAGVFIGALDTSVIGPALSLIAGGFHVTLVATAWAVSIYTVAYVASTVLAGAGGDRYGRRRVFTAGILAFGVASAIAAVSGRFWLFLAARALQGAGAGAVYPSAQAEGIAQFPAQRRGMALGIFGAVFGLAAIIGPNVGGALAQWVGWPAIFLINIPFVLLVLLLVRRTPEALAPGDATIPDWLGGISFGGFLASALLALSAGGSGGRLAGVGAALVCGVVFLSRQRRATRPFLDTEPLTNRAGMAMIAGAALIGLDMSAAVFIPTLVQDRLHFSVFASGVALMPAALSGAVLAGVGGVLTDRMGPRGILQVGLVAGAVGGVLLALPGLTLLTFVLAMLALGVATAFTMGAPLNRMALGLYRDEQAGEALSLVAVFRAVGLAAGPIVLTLLLSRHGWAGMYGGVAVASVLGVLLFFAVPDIRPLPAPRRSTATGRGD